MGPAADDDARRVQASPHPSSPCSTVKPPEQYGAAVSPSLQPGRASGGVRAAPVGHHADVDADAVPAEWDGGDVRLVDCGDGRRLDRLGPYLVDRPAPAVPLPPLGAAAAWAAADARYERTAAGSGWAASRIPGGRWTVGVAGLRLELRLAAGGQVGIFLEHVALWDLVRRHLAGGTGRRVLNLFAYTGGASLAAAATGAEVVHVDASRTAVAWARRNAALSGLADAPIRWIVDDAEAFARREARRGRRYDLVVLDPPSYGHGRRARAWRLEERLPGLLDACVAVAGADAALLLSTHTPGYDAERLRLELGDALARRPSRLAVGGRDEPGRIGALERSIDAGPMRLRADSGAALPAGAFAFISGSSGEHRPG